MAFPRAATPKTPTVNTGPAYGPQQVRTQLRTPYPTNPAMINALLKQYMQIAQQGKAFAPRVPNPPTA